MFDNYKVKDVSTSVLTAGEAHTACNAIDLWSLVSAQYGD